MAHISVVIPVYKAEECLHELYRRLKESLCTLTEDFEIILVEDCGGDRSWEIIEELAGRDPRVKGVQFSRNFGQHYGITAGLERSSGDWVVIMDCDLQERPEEIPRLYRKALEGWDVVLARRPVQSGHGPLKRLASWLFAKLFTWLADLEYDNRVGGFRIISRRVVDTFCTMRERLRFINALITWMGFPTTYVDVQHDERYSGSSTYTFTKLFRLAAEAIIAYSDKPLRLSIKFGFAMAFFAFLFGIYIILRVWLYGVVVPGYYSLIVSLYFLSGIIIANMGIIGIYLGKTFEEARKRPLYIVAHSVGFEARRNPPVALREME